jgi:hypothetical protein
MSQIYKEHKKVLLDNLKPLFLVFQEVIAQEKNNLLDLCFKKNKIRLKILSNGLGKWIKLDNQLQFCINIISIKTKEIQNIHMKEQTGIPLEKKH